jgi:hypothetical protein
MPRKGQFVSRDKLATMFALYMRTAWEFTCNPSPAIERAMLRLEALLASVKPAN